MLQASVKKMVWCASESANEEAIRKMNV